MKASLQESKIHLSFHPVERKILQAVFRVIETNYQRDPKDFTDSEQQVWYSTHGCTSSGMDEEDTHEWVKNLHQHRLGNLELLRQCLLRLDHPDDPQAPVTIVLTLDQAPSFLTILNDHRLLLHARHGLGDEDLIFPFLEADQSLNPSQKSARLEIDLLAQIMEVVLRLIPNSGADWQDSVDEWM